jgi:alpha-beta hydrolase superfamily lysophospholipase
MAARCLAGPGAVRALAAALLARDGVFVEAPPTAGALGERLRENVPPVRAGMPVLVAQGEDDPLVSPDLQRGWIDARCAEGATLRRLDVAGRDHLTVVAPDSPLVPALLAWTRERFEGRPHPPGCGG